MEGGGEKDQDRFHNLLLPNLRRAIYIFYFMLLVTEANSGTKWDENHTRGWLARFCMIGDHEKVASKGKDTYGLS